MATGANVMYRISCVPVRANDPRPWLVQDMRTGEGAWGSTPDEALARFRELWGDLHE